MDIAKRGVWSRRDFLASGVLFPSAIRLLGQGTRSGSARFLSYDEVRAILESRRVPLPAGLANKTDQERRSAWPAWIQEHDQQIRARLIRGEEDTLANFLMFGVSFTTRPRIAPEVEVFDPDDPIFRGRIEDFLAALASPGDNQRLVLMGNLLRMLGHETATAEQRERVAGYIEHNIQRYLSERARYEQTVRRTLQNDTAPSAATAHLYRDRGLSLDTDFRPNYAVEHALAEAIRRGLAGSVRRVAIIGPGLDFTDKDAGFDHYPLQSLQPFALVDSLLKLGVSELRTLRVTLFDISVPVLEHLSDAVERAKSGEIYTLQLILDPARNWNRDVMDYWRQMGSRIGPAVTPLPAPQRAAGLERRALGVLPEVVTSLQPAALNIVAQTLDLAADQRFDLIVATNVFIYYDALDQALALLNLQSMLAPAGVVLTNDLFQNFPGVRLQTVASLQVNFTPSQADQMQLYSTPAFGPQLPPQ